MRLVLLASLLALGCVPEGECTLRLTNDTGEELTAVFASPATQADFGDEVLDVPVPAEPGTEVRIALPAAGRYDLRGLAAADGDGDCAWFTAYDSFDCDEDGEPELTLDADRRDAEGGACD